MQCTCPGPPFCCTMSLHCPHAALIGSLLCCSGVDNRVLRVLHAQQADREVPGSGHLARSAGKVCRRGEHLFEDMRIPGTMPCAPGTLGLWGSKSMPLPALLLSMQHVMKRPSWGIDLSVPSWATRDQHIVSRRTTLKCLFSESTQGPVSD